MKSLFVGLFCASLTGLCNAWWTFEQALAVCDRMHLHCSDLKHTIATKLGFADIDNVCFEDPIHKCTCVEMLYSRRTLDPKVPILSEVDILPLYRSASKFYHGDKRDRGTADDFLFLTQCKELLLNIHLQREYMTELKRVLTKCSVKKYDDDLCRDAMIESLNERLVVNPSKKVAKNKDDASEKQAKDKEDEDEDEPQTEVIYLILDDSGSMGWDNRLTVGKEQFRGLWQRLLTDDVYVSMIGSKAFCKRVFDGGPMTNASIDTVLDQWNGGSGSTYLWEYVWQTIEETSVKVESGSAKQKECEVVVITDGEDTDSPGAFNGVNGLNEVMSRLSVNKLQMCRLYVLCLSDECSSVEVASKFRDMTKASGGIFCDKNSLHECVLVLRQTNGFRRAMQTVFKLEYVQMLDNGEAMLLDWFQPPPPGSIETTDI